MLHVNYVFMRALYVLIFVNKNMALLKFTETVKHTEYCHYFLLILQILSTYAEEWRLPVKIKCCKNEIYSMYCGKVLGFPTDAAAGVHCSQVLILFSQKNKIVYGIFQWRHLELFTCLVFTIFTLIFIGLHWKLALFVLWKVNF